MAVKPIPDNHPRVIPYLCVQDAAALIDFLRTVFDAREAERIARPDGKVGHAELRIGDSVIMLAEAGGEHPAMPAAHYVYVENADAVYRCALDAGATSLMEPADQFYGDRHGGVKDKTGNTWWIASHVEDVPPEEMQKRAKAMFEAKHAVA